jgi:hypothetical protein
LTSQRRTLTDVRKLIQTMEAALMTWGRRRKEEGEEPMYWPGMQPQMYYPMMYPPPTSGGSDSEKEYRKYLKKQLRALETKGKEGDKKKGEDKKIWWKRTEVGAALFFFSPVIATLWVGMAELCVHLVKSLVQ